MSSESLISSIVQRHGLALSGSVIPSESSPDVFYAPIDMSNLAPSDVLGQSDLEQRLSAAFVKAGIAVEMYFVNTPVLRIEESVRSVLFSSFGNKIRDVRTSRIRGHLIVEIYLNEDADVSTRKRIEIFTEKLLKLLGLSDFYVTQIDQKKIITKTEILSVIRILSPATIEEILCAIKKRGFEDLNHHWASKNLDLLRKEGLLVRTKGGRYALTFNALNKLGTVKAARSPDVMRLLALASAQA